MPATWLCVLTALAWGFWSFALKQATKTSHPYMVQVLGSLMSVAFLPLHLIALRLQGLRLQPSWTSIGWVVGAAVFATAASVTNLFALSKVDVGPATAIAASYPVVTMLIAYLAGSETMTGAKMLGALFVVVGVVVLARA